MGLGQKIVLIMALFVMGLFVFSLVGYGLSSLIFGLGIQDLGDYENYQSIQALKFVQVIVTIGTFIFPVWVFSSVTQHNFSSYFDTKNLNPNLLIVVTAIGICALPLIGWMAEMNMLMTFPDSLSWLEEMLRSAEEHAQKITMAFLAMNNINELLVNLFVMAVLPALGEELLFRGALQGTLIKHTKNVHLSIWVSAALFSGIHMQFFGFFPRMILGAMFGYLVVWGGSTWYSIWAHFINNAIMVLLMFYIGEGVLDAEFENFGGNSGDWIYVIVSLVFTVALLWFFKGNTRGTPLEYPDEEESF